jgi:hypothetical protein
MRLGGDNDERHRCADERNAGQSYQTPVPDRRPALGLLALGDEADDRRQRRPSPVPSAGDVGIYGPKPETTPDRICGVWAL